MEKSSCVFNVVFNYQKVLEHFNLFYNLLQDSDRDLESLDISKYFECLDFIVKNDFFDTYVDEIHNEKLYSILNKIFDALCLKYFDNTHNYDIKLEKISNITYLFNSVALMIKILLPKCIDRSSLKYLFYYIADSFNKYSHIHAIDSIEDDFEKEYLMNLLKFFVNILQSLGPVGISIHVSQDVLTPLVKFFPFSNKHALNLYVNRIIPNLFCACDYNLKKHILELMWQKIIDSYEEDYSSSTESSSNVLLCCFSDYMFQDYYELKNFHISNNAIWKLIQNNLTVDISYKRKQALYVFKVILFWIKTNNFVSSTTVLCNNVPFFMISTVKDLLIWNDLVVLFECLEEKQIHVIKPILPKFSRILQQASKKCDKQPFILHPSWITCLIKRMIFHESKFIKKQALSMAMCINFKECLIHKLHSKEFMKLITDGFNDQNMYCRMNESDNWSLYLSSNKIASFLSSYIEAFETESQKVSFLRYLLEVISSNSWCGVALIHVIFALTKLDGFPSWRSDDIMYIRNIIQGCLKTHESLIRRAIEHWMLKSCILFVDWKSLNFEDIAELLFIFKTFERHTVIWDAFVSKLKEIFSLELSDSLSVTKAKEFSFSCINKILAITNGKSRPSENDLQKMAILLVLLADSGIISFNLEETTVNWFHLLQPITSILKDAPKRPYMSEDKLYSALQLYTFILDATLRNMEDINDKHSSAIINCLNCSVEFLEFIFQKSLMDIKGSDNIINFQVLFNSLHIFLSVETFREMFVKVLPSFLNNYDHIPSHILSKKIILVLLFKFSNDQFHNKEITDGLHFNPFKELTFNFLSKIVSECVINDLLRTMFVNDTEKEAWMKLSLVSVNNFWKTATCVAISLSYSDQKDLILALVQLVLDAFDGGSKSTYASTIECTGSLIPKLGLNNVDNIEKMLNVAYKACSELRGCEAYRPAIESFIKAIFQPFILNEIFFDILYKYIDCFQNFSENSLGIFYLVIKQFCDTFPLAHLHKVNFNYIPFLIYSLTYGPIHHKSQKILEDSIANISDQDKYFYGELKNYNKPSIFVRITAITYLLNNLYKKSTESEEISLKIIDALLSSDKTIKLSRSSTFANSYNHRVRNRIWQCILLLQPNLLSESENINFFKRILDLLEFENQQPSIRYLQEWLIVKVIHINKYLVADFISILEKSLEKRPGFLVSLLSVLIHLMIHDFLLSENQVSKCFPILINYCMAQNFAVRLYSRLALTKLFVACEENNFVSLTQKYDFLHSLSLSQEVENGLLEKGNIYKNLIKLQEEFYFSVFHPIKHFTLETIFFELPRLSNLAPEEWIKAEYFKHHLSSEFNLIACFNSDNFLKISKPVYLSTNSVEEPSVENNSFDYNFQKKISPVKSELYDCIPDVVLENKSKRCNLIVIASLIDKIPNLGGLCRTCEVFGVEQFVIGSLKYTEDKTFQNLAVSSDRWVSIKEVKPYHLKEYLLSLKDEGYILIGAEQTDDSYKLSNYVFPKKSALILGHEKEGMPVDLIQVLDVCVEIPQQGIIRSLNVHVSGAIFIWEYARQQIKP